MSTIDVIAMVGEMLSWVGAIAGIPLLVVALVLRGRDRRRQPVGVAVVDDLEDQRVAIWSAGGRTYSRPLAPHEELAVTDDGLVGFSSPRRPDRMHVQRRSPAARACTALAITLLAAAVLGFAASLLPLFA